jgi:hypothetical protein
VFVVLRESVVARNEEKLHHSVRRTQAALRNNLIELMKKKKIRYGNRNINTE